MPKGVPKAPRAVVCVQCDATFWTRHSQGRYCSSDCRRLGNRQHWVGYGVRNRAARRAYHRELYQRNKEKVADRVRAYHQTDQWKAIRRTLSSDPDKVRARQLVRRAVLAGYLRKEPCRCGATNVEGHHPDYSRPLEVVWLCKPCHVREHSQPRRAQ